MNADRAGRACDFLLVVLSFALPLSIAFSEIALLTAIACWLLSAPWNRSPAPFARPVLLATAALAATWLLASATAVDPLASLVKARKLYSIVLVPILLDRVRGEGTAARLAGAAIAGGVLSAVFGIADFVWSRWTSPIPGVRLDGVFSTAMTTGNVFATLAIAAVGEGLLQGGVAARRAFAAAAVIGLALVGTLTRSSWLGFLAGVAPVVGFRRPLLLALGALALALGLLFGPAEVRDRAASIFDPTYETNAGRISLWKSGLAVIADHPWTGVGLADHYELIERYRRSDATFHAGHFHNNLVQVAASTGLIGFAVWGAWMGVVAHGLIRGMRRAPGGGRALVGLGVWLAFHVHGFFDWGFGDAEVANQLFLWVGLGLASLSGGTPNALADKDLPAR